VIDVAALKSANLVAQTAESVKVFLSGELKKPVKLRGVKVTAGAKKAIETAGGEVLP